MNAFKPSALTAAMIASGLAFSSFSVVAQQTEEAKADNQDVEVIEISGFRRSVVESINTKRFSTSVVEAISAEDIGKLPDSSIAESIARLPGLTAQRLDGRASKISIRGFGENESDTTFNGREQVSIGDNRGVEFDLYPSEIMSGVTVYKTPDASLEAEGIAGVIDMQTVKPLSKGERVISINGQFEKSGFDKLNPDGKDKGYRGTFAYIDQFMDDRLGVAFAVNTMSSPNQEKRWNSWGFMDWDVDGETYSLLGGAKPFVRSSVLDRNSAMLVVEALPSDNVHMTFDALYVDFSDDKILRGIEIPFGWGQNTDTITADAIDEETGFITSATTYDQRVVVRNDRETRDAKLKSFGFNTTWTATDTLTVAFDASYSKVERDIWSFESYAGTGRGDNEGASDVISYTFKPGNTGATFTHQLDYSDFDLVKLGGALSWGSSAALNSEYGLEDGDAYYNGAQDGFINAPEINDELKTVKLDASQLLDGEIFSELKFGVSYREREKAKLSAGYYMTLKDFPEMVTVPEDYRLGSVSLDFIGMGDMIAYDSAALLRDGYYNLLSEAETNSSHITKSWNVNEKVTSAFVMSNINTEIAGFSLTGNAGVRVLHTKQHSEGAAAQSVDGYIVAQPTSDTYSYNHVLPSLNLNLKIDDAQTVRFGAAKTLSRANLDDMNASVTVDYSETPDSNGNYWSVSGGNPGLKPKEAIGIDLSYENYFSAEGYVSVAVFWKDLTNWVFDGSYELDMDGIADPETGEVPANSTASGSGKQNGDAGTLTGYEVALSLPFNVFADALDGFGIIASYTGVTSDIQDLNGNDYELPGLSDSIVNFTGYYEKNGLQLRASMRKRGDFKGDVYGLGYDTTQVNIVGETIWDAQIGYDFGEAGFTSLEGLSIFLQAQNLTEEPFTSLSGDNALQVRDYQDYGRNYLLGFSYKL